MLCRTCWRDIRPEAIFCVHCGTQIRPAPGSPPTPEPTPVIEPSAPRSFLERLFSSLSVDRRGRTVIGDTRQGPRAESHPAIEFRLRDDFLSRAEAEFMRVLLHVLPDGYLLCPKVNLGDLFYAPHDQGGWNRINRKHVDFVVCDAQTLRPAMGIELDDRSHQRLDRQERDRLVEAVFATAGLPLMRVPVRSVYNATELEIEFRQLLRLSPGTVSTAPEVGGHQTASPLLCPKCRTLMVVRTTKHGPNAGRQFYGCPNYPRCTGMVNI